MHDDPTTLSGARYPDPVTLGRYRIEARLAIGRASLVYRGVDTTSGAPVCVKLLAPPRDASEDDVERFLERARALLGFSHPHVPEVLHVGREGTRAFFATRLVEGEDLQRALGRQRALPLVRALGALRDAALALDAGLSRGLVHGDVRPRHLLVSRDGVQLVGFSQSMPWRTAHGRELWGDAAYVAPEVALGRPPDFRSDLYALACTGYELLTGSTPFGVGAPDALLACHVHEPFPKASARVPTVPPDVDALLARMGAKRPEARPASYAEVIERLTELVHSASRGGPERPRLVVEAGRQRGLCVALPDGELLLGRFADEGFAVDDARVSRRHARLLCRAERVEIEDLASRNGVLVNGQRVARAVLAHGDRVQLGDTVFSVVVPKAYPSALLDAQPSLPVLLPASPVRGAFGEAEVAHAPGQQLSADGLDACDEPEAAKVRLRVLAGLARVLAAPGERHALGTNAVRALVAALGADDGLWVSIEEGAPVLDARTSAEAELLSCALPAVERALPGQLSLSSTVKVGRDGVWGVALAPVRASDEVRAYAVLLSHAGRFDAHALAALEGACALLSTHTADVAAHA